MEGCCDNMKMVSSRTPNSAGLGQLDIVDDIFGWATSLFGKDPQKVEYDRIRQQAWDSLVQLVDEHGQFTASGTMTRSIAQKFIETLTQLMDGFKKYTDGMLAKYPGDSGWITPRFHDYYDFMGQIRTGWQQELATMPADYVNTVVDYVEDFFGGGVSPTTSIPTFPSSPTMQPYPNQQVPVQSAGMGSSINMLLIGGVVLGLVLMSRKRG